MNGGLTPYSIAPTVLLNSGRRFGGVQALDGAVYGGLGHFQQMPHRQNFRPLGSGQSLTAIECCGRSAVEQACGVEQGVFEAQVFDVNALGGQVMVDGAVEGGAVFSGVMGWIGDDFFHFAAPG